MDRQKYSGRPTIRNKENIEAVKQLVEEGPQASVRPLQQESDLSYCTCRRIIKHDLHLHNYNLEAIHKIRLIDKQIQQ